MIDPEVEDYKQKHGFKTDLEAYEYLRKSLQKAIGADGDATI